MKLSEMILTEVRKTIEQMRIDRQVAKDLKDQLKKQKKNSGIHAFEAQIYSKHGGVAFTVYSFQKNASEAIREIQARPDFKKFAKRPVKVKLEF